MPVPDGEDPRADLVARLLAYERLRRVAEGWLGYGDRNAALSIRERDWVRGMVEIEIPALRPQVPRLSLPDILAATRRLGI